MELTNESTSEPLFLVNVHLSCAHQRPEQRSNNRRIGLVSTMCQLGALCIESFRKLNYWASFWLVFTVVGFGLIACFTAPL